MGDVLRIIDRFKITGHGVIYKSVKAQMFAWEIFCLILGEIDLKLVESKCLEERYRKEKCPSISKSESTQSSIKPIFR